jgi:trehalose-6-phosphate hydrolase
MTHWWHERVLYEIYTPSYYDSNKDGIGDISGIKQKLDYIQSLGIGAIWLTPFYSSPKVDNGYDISDYYTVDSAYGCNNDIDQLIKEAHKRDIKIVIDMVLNHTSDQHPWFIESRSSKKNPKRDWYIWKDSVKGIPPNNWESFFSGSAWEYDQKTNSYYYHAFSKAQVDLNWSNVDVRSAMYDVLIFWLEKGVDGFRLDVINFLKTDN